MPLEAFQGLGLAVHATERNLHAAVHKAGGGRQCGEWVVFVERLHRRPSVRVILLTMIDRATRGGWCDGGRERTKLTGAL